MSNILKRMTTMIKLVVYNQPTVVRRITPYMRFDRLGTSRGIMYITQGSMSTRGIYVCSYTGLSYIKHFKCSSVNISINNHNPCLCQLYQLFKQESGLKELTIEKHLLNRRDVSADKEVNLFFVFMQFFLNSLKTMLLYIKPRVNLPLKR